MKCKMNKKGFSFIELLVSSLLLLFVLSGFLSLNQYFVKNKDKSMELKEILNLHNKVKYLFSQKDSCLASLQSVNAHGEITLRLEQEGEEYKLLPANKDQNTSKNYRYSFSKNSNYAINYSITQDGELFEGEGNVKYAKVKANYKLLNKKNNKTNKDEFEIIVPVFTEEDGQISKCLIENVDGQCASSEFMTGLSESALNPIDQHSLNTEENPGGKEYLFKSGNLHSEGGEYCISHNICTNSEWRKSALCYDTCGKDKIWWDGKAEYENYNEDKLLEINSEINSELNKKNSNKICPEYDENNPIFHFIAYNNYNNLECGTGNGLGDRDGLKQIPEGVYGQEESLTTSWSKNEGGEGGEEGKFTVELNFECTYAGTWKLVEASCKETNEANEVNPLWELTADRKVKVGGIEIDTGNEVDKLTCATSGKGLPTIKSHDYNQGTDDQKKERKNTINNLGHVFGNKRYHIGEPRRIIAFFKDPQSTTSATIYCPNPDDNSWSFLDKDNVFVKNCNSLIIPKAKVNIIFVIDNSGSMGDEQVALSKAMKNFFDEFFEDTAILDRINPVFYRITTDYNGQTEEKRFVRRSLPDWKNETERNNMKRQLETDMTSVGIEGSGHEKPLQSLYNLLDTFNNKTHRKGRDYLAIFFITDEEGNNDESFHLGSRKKSLRYKIESLNKLSGESESEWKHRVIVYAVVNPENWDTGSNKARSVTRITNGFNFSSGDKIFNIEDSSYGRHLSKFAKEIADRVLIIGQK